MNTFFLETRRVLFLGLLLLTLDGFAADFRETFQQLVSAARGDFTSVMDESTKEVDDEGDQSYDCVPRFAGVARGTVWYYKDPDLTPTVRFSIARRLKDQAEASEKYSDFKRRLTEALPSGWTSSERTSDLQTSS